MIRLALILAIALPSALWVNLCQAQDEDKEEPYTIEALNDNGWWEVDLNTGTAIGKNGVIFTFSGAFVTADSILFNEKTGDISADGSVRIQRDEQIWVGDHILYNYKTRQMEAHQFRTGKSPVFAQGEGLHADTTNHLYTATNAYVTTDDIAKPAVKVRAKYLKIIPGKRLEARHAVLYVEGVPVFYFPYYTRSLEPRANNFNFVPGYRSRYGPYLLGSYDWLISEQLEAILHLDYRERRGLGGGPDLNYHLGRWGDGSIRGYYIHDLDPNAQLTNDIPKDRGRFSFNYLGNPFTNFTVRSQVRYQSDLGVLHDFFESEHRDNPQPSTFVEANKLWQNFNLDLYVQPRVNDFQETVERLPDLRFTGYRQQLGETPLFYESESSLGYYRRLFPETNGPTAALNYSATRADTYHQVVLPETFFGWLNLTPRVGGRFTWYSEASGPGATTDELSRGVFNTGAELSFKASRLWPAANNSLLEVNGLRHIIEPSLNYVYVPNPNYSGTNEIPQFDSELPSLRLLPIEFPDYNAIDSIDSQNVIRFGVHNKLQTKREGSVVDLVNWNLYTDWRLRPRRDQRTFSDIYSDLIFRPRTWLTLGSVMRYDINNGFCTLALHTLTFQPSDVWSWSGSHYYLRDDLSPSPTALGVGNNLFTSSLFYKLNENWAFRAYHRFEARDGRLQEQDYSIYRDLRNWTAALTFRLRDNANGPDDVSVAVTFSLKAYPRFGLGSDSVHSSYLLGH